MLELYKEIKKDYLELAKRIYNCMGMSDLGFIRLKYPMPVGYIKVCNLIKQMDDDHITEAMVMIDDELDFNNATKPLTNR